METLRRERLGALERPAHGGYVLAHRAAVVACGLWRGRRRQARGACFLRLGRRGGGRALAHRHIELLSRRGKRGGRRGGGWSTAQELVDLRERHASQRGERDDFRAHH